jgi:hypothetical protein
MPAYSGVAKSSLPTHGHLNLDHNCFVRNAQKPKCKQFISLGDVSVVGIERSLGFFASSLRNLIPGFLRRYHKRVTGLTTF